MYRLGLRLGQSEDADPDFTNWRLPQLRDLVRRLTRRRDELLDGSTGLAVWWGEIDRLPHRQRPKAYQFGQFESELPKVELLKIGKRLDEAISELKRRGADRGSAIKAALMRTAPSVDALSSRESTIEPFEHTKDYRSVTFGGNSYTFTSRQAQVVQLLHEAHERGTPELGKDLILEELDSKSSRLRDTFKAHNAWGRLIVNGSKRGTYRLDLSDAQKPR